jgi:hypothetical protein
MERFNADLIFQTTAFLFCYIQGGFLLVDPFHGFLLHGSQCSQL